MCFSSVRLTEHDPNTATVAFPSRNTGAEVFVSVGDALVILFLELVFVSIGIRITTAPKFLDEAFALVVRGQFLECLPLFVRDDVSNVFVEPVLVGLLQFGLYISRFGARVLLVLCEQSWTGAKTKS